MGKLTKGQTSILKALAKGDTIKGNLADPAGFYPAKAVLKRARRHIEPSDVEVLYRADLLDKQYQGLGNYVGVATPAGRARFQSGTQEARDGA